MGRCDAPIRTAESDAPTFDSSHRNRGGQASSDLAFGRQARVAMVATSTDRYGRAVGCPPRMYRRSGR